MEKYLHQDEVAKLLNSSTRYVYEKRRDGSLPGVKIAGKWLFRESDIEKFLNKKFDEENKNDR